LAALAEVVQKVRVRRLHRPDGLATLSQVIEVLADDLAAHAASPQASQEPGQRW
jgi:hypothetical protein